MRAELQMAAEGLEKQPRGERAWYVDGQGHTMIRISGPVEFRMGSPLGEPERGDDEVPHRVRIPRSLAIAAGEVTVEQFDRFLRAHPNSAVANPRNFKPLPDAPITSVSWLQAAQYCRWLSEQEGLPEDQMCYPPVPEIKPGMHLPANYLARTGYRLPTEAEWEYTCRAGAATNWYYGSDPMMLDRYGWYSDNSNDHAWPSGLLQPNDLGLFAMHGNVWQWCQGRYAPYPEVPQGGVVVDREDATLTVPADQDRVLRGGAFNCDSPKLRCAYRGRAVPTRQDVDTGFRVVRTLP